MDQQFLQECSLLIGQSIHVINPLLDEEAQRAVAQRIIKAIFQEAENSSVLKENIMKGYQHK